MYTFNNFILDKIINKILINYNLSSSKKIIVKLSFFIRKMNIP